MENLNKKIIGNAVAAYPMIFISLIFLISKDTKLNHPFVKSHVKSAFVLHLMFILVLFIMSYPFLDSITIFAYSLNSIISATLLIAIFIGVLYGMHQAHKGKTVTLGEMFHKAGVSKNLMSQNSSENIAESQAIIMILSHVPFLGYIVGSKNLNLAHMHDILKFNLIVTLVACLFFIFGYGSLASVIMLGYIIWSTAQGISLITQGTIMSIGLDIIPSPEEKYIIQKSLFTYIGNTLKKNTFIPYKEIKSKIKSERSLQEKKSEQNLPYKNYYITRNWSVIIILCITILFIFEANERILLLFLFPASYMLGYIDRKAYRMPYIYDIYALVSNSIWKVTHIFSKARTLKNTTKQETIQMGETKKES